MWLSFLNILFGLIIGISYALTIVHGEVATYVWAGMIAEISAGGFMIPANEKLIYQEIKINEGEDEK